MQEKLNILIVEDVSFDAELVEYKLRREGLQFSSMVVEKEVDFRKALEEFKPDIILSDHSLPSFDGSSALKIAKEKSPDIPFFFVSGKIGEEYAVEMLKTGATDYIFKSNLSKLTPAIYRALKESDEKSERKKQRNHSVKLIQIWKLKFKKELKNFKKPMKNCIWKLGEEKNWRTLCKKVKKKLKEVIHFSPVPQFVIDTHHDVIYWNKALELHSKIPADEIVGTKNHWKAFYDYKRPCMADLLVDESYDDIPQYFGNKYKRSIILDDACEAIDLFPDLGENGKWLHFTAAAIRNSKGDIIGAVETLQDITEQKNAEMKIMKSLEEKEVLLREIHHRVKNNLQIISSLINLQSNHIDDAKILENFKEIQNRIKSIALIHEKLYQSQNLSKINFAEYIPQLTSEIYRSYEITHSIDLDINVDPILLDINKALPCGLIINELITNSIKHAFPNAKISDDQSDKTMDTYKKCKMGIDFKCKGEGYEMKVFDNGIGYPEDLDLENTETLGLRLVNSLKDQLYGEAEIKNFEGAFFMLTFKE